MQYHSMAYMHLGQSRQPLITNSMQKDAENILDTRGFFLSDRLQESQPQLFYSAQHSCCECTDQKPPQNICCARCQDANFLIACCCSIPFPFIQALLAWQVYKDPSSSSSCDMNRYICTLAHGFLSTTVPCMSTFMMVVKVNDEKIQARSANSCISLANSLWCWPCTNGDIYAEVARN